MRDLVIRKANPSDWQTIQELNDKIFKINFDFDTSIDPDWEYSQVGKDYFKERCTNPKYITFIVFENNIPAGYADGYIEVVEYYLPYLAKTGIIENLGVLAEHQRKGLATLLVKNLVVWLKNQGATSISVESYYQNSNAINFYQSLGFTPSDIILKKEI